MRSLHARNGWAVDVEGRTLGTTTETGKVPSAGGGANEALATRPYRESGMGKKRRRQAPVSERAPFAMGRRSGFRERCVAEKDRVRDNSAPNARALFAIGQRTGPRRPGLPSSPRVVRRREVCGCAFSTLPSRGGRRGPGRGRRAGAFFEKKGLARANARRGSREAAE